ncbi:glutaredoxin-like YruB-family protein [Clostridium tetanomorphum]|uniref:NrdH-redoxin n=1 Tax=Clostridium tetanomorphum TaxID=1553 RepID=A0A923J0U3_CLOTT|nr:Uxx-star family glutaredoxin-like (seleno)protein [Clostridium tetanomorphum]KAJ53922.1 rubredoxin [Clostridium tetanomorphum DSM 665]MBC2398094.1 NrdH-redoxin [Clostridium tetanomorphum]MBP1864663.1 glutaredoxin-like YruB-family protein [Clostridium tetanomorphum]NRS84133.1 glutaredoxin-like YruB-family protein [Clostridium tetanomorphum]NRZ97346.1 glutaredoxin-like YruB-family protein [Clostridium tetanomorphum]
MIKIYTTATCPYCKKAKAYLDMKKVEYENIDVLKDKKGREELIKLSGQQSVPVLNIHGEIMVGFDKYAIDEALNKLVEV